MRLAAMAGVSVSGMPVLGMPVLGMPVLGILAVGMLDHLQRCHSVQALLQSCWQTRKVCREGRRGDT